MRNGNLDPLCGGMGISDLLSAGVLSAVWPRPKMQPMRTCHGSRWGQCRPVRIKRVKDKRNFKLLIGCNVIPAFWMFMQYLSWYEILNLIPWQITSSLKSNVWEHYYCTGSDTVTVHLDAIHKLVMSTWDRQSLKWSPKYRLQITFYCGYTFIAVGWKANIIWSLLHRILQFVCNNECYPDYLSRWWMLR